VPAFHRAATRLLLLTCLLAFSACQGLPPTSAPPGQPQTPTPAAWPAASPQPGVTTRPRPTASATPALSSLSARAGQLAGMVVRFYHPWGATAGPRLRALAVRFNRENLWGLRVEAEGLPGFDALDAAARAHAGSPAGGVILAYPYQLLNWQAAQPGLLAELDGPQADPALGLAADWQAQLYPALAPPALAPPALAPPALAPQTALLWLPLLGSSQALYYNLTWAAELGFERPPRTPAELRQQACAAARTTRADQDPANDRQGGYIAATRASAGLSWLAAYEATVLRPAGEGYRFNTAETQQALRFLKELYDLGCAWMPAQEDSQAAFAGRGGLFASGAAAEIAGQTALFKQAGNADNWTMIAMPGIGGAPAVASGPAGALLAGSPEQELAGWLFLRWLAEPSQQAALAGATGFLPASPAGWQVLTAGSPPDEPRRAAETLLQAAAAEPQLESWLRVRWALGDAFTQLYRDYFESDQIPVLAQFLEATAQDLHRRTP
jgi:multiple sugar transport system substrate-binding protein/sn-glycerol 3-phosphate transport system substrate-binding protein